MKKRLIPFLLLLFTCLAVQVFGQPATCQVSATLYKPAASGSSSQLCKFCEIQITQASSSGNLTSTLPVTIKDENGDGIITFTAIQGSTIRIKGNVYGFTNGANITVPSGGSCPAVLGNLATIVSLPTNGLTVKTNNVALALKQGVVDFSSRFTVTESPSSESNIDLASVITPGTCTACDLTIDAYGRVTNKGSGSGGGSVTSVFGRTGVVAAATNDYTWAQVNKSTSSIADIATRSASDLSSGTLPDGRFPATLPAASGLNLTALNATNLASGTVPDARFPATLPAASGVNLTALNATNLASGTVPDARFPATLPAASGANLTALNATQLTSGAVPAARMPALTGDVTTSAGAVATTIANDAVTFAKFQNINTAKLLGRSTASSGDVEEISIGSGLSLSGGSLSATGGGGSGDVVGPASATDNAVVRFDTTTGKLIQNSVVTIADTTGNMAGVGTLNTHTIPGGTSTFAMLGIAQTWTATQTLAAGYVTSGFKSTRGGATLDLINSGDASFETRIGQYNSANTALVVQGAGSNSVPIQIIKMGATPAAGGTAFEIWNSSAAFLYKFHPSIWQIQKEASADPAVGDLTAGDHFAIYRKNDKLVIAYNNAGTITYLTIPLDGSTTTFTQSTTAP